jgi:hypothetical protein
VKYVYIAGPYGDRSGYCTIDERINNARKVAKLLAEAGIPFYSPHLNCAHFEVIAPKAPVEFWKAMGLGFVDNAAMLLVIRGWEASKGTLAEIARAEELDIPWSVDVGDIIINWHAKYGNGYLAARPAGEG